MRSWVRKLRFQDEGSRAASSVPVSTYNGYVDHISPLSHSPAQINLLYSPPSFTRSRAALKTAYLLRPDPRLTSEEHHARFLILRTMIEHYG